MGANQWHGVEPILAAAIRYAARHLIKTTSLTTSDQDGIEQELALMCLVRLRRFDPSRGSRSTFINHIVRNGVRTLLEKRSAARRNPSREAFSLDAPVACDAESESEITFGEVTQHPDDTQDPYDLALDVGLRIYGLPAELADLCERLQHQTVTEISRETGIPRGTLYDWIRKIREAWNPSGLRDYL